MVDKSLAELFRATHRLDAERDGADTVEFPDELLQAARQAEIARVVAGKHKLPSCAARPRMDRRRSCANASSS